MQWIAASEVSIEELCELWNGAYEGYFYPATYTPELLERLIRTGSIDLRHSALLAVDGEMAGLSFLGVRGDRGWIGSFGIRKPFRGRGLSGPLMREQLRRAWRLGLSRVQLEVLYKNETAKRVYERTGFETIRQVVVLQGAAGAFPATQAEGAADAYPVTQAEGAREVSAAEGLALIRTLQGGRRIAWQREAASVSQSGDARYITLNEEGALAFEERPTGIRISEVIVADGADHARVLRALLTGLTSLAPGKAAVLLNEPEDGMVSALMAEGFVESDRQFEMWVYSSAGDSPRRSFSA